MMPSSSVYFSTSRRLGIGLQIQVRDVLEILSLRDLEICELGLEGWTNARPQGRGGDCCTSAVRLCVWSVTGPVPPSESRKDLFKIESGHDREHEFGAKGREGEKG
jgi:hypothetical protein